jgi:hypothetical protein
MMTDINEFIYEFCKNEKMLAAKQEFLDTFEEPSLTLVICGYFGRGMAENFQSFSQDEMERLSSLIEENINSDDEYLGTCIATGLLEALYNECHEIGNWDDVKQALGEEAMHYIEAWNKANGV